VCVSVCVCACACMRVRVRVRVHVYETVNAPAISGDPVCLFTSLVAPPPPPPPPPSPLPVCTPRGQHARAPWVGATRASRLLVRAVGAGKRRGTWAHVEVEDGDLVGVRRRVHRLARASRWRHHAKENIAHRQRRDGRLADVQNGSNLRAAEHSTMGSSEQCVSGWNEFKNVTTTRLWTYSYIGHQHAAQHTHYPSDS
jgi:hypothetical protein